ncbi:MAG: type I-E CRISPR-associated protein Cse1/CasA [Oscillospiraceae bacterium]|jgi:CRISPR system Cascade subunit CasA|nr:type I-E CRISPR-associated protein Cse1/CasA [Oscillospiraceae bacterium]
MQAFNLLEEPWILVRAPDGDVSEISLLTLFRNAHRYQSLAGESPTQDMAILRLLLAILHGALGSEFATDDDDEADEPYHEALSYWRSIWQAGQFDYECIHTYLAPYADRFYLIHPTHPFYQVADMAKGTAYSAPKLIGDLAESSNKKRLFSQRTAQGKASLSFAEAARWLPHLHGFDDTASKPTEKGLPSSGAGWLGRLGLLAAAGESLFHTLMLNWVLLPDGANTVWGADKPIWELPPRKAERVQIPVPNSQAALLTLQSRRVALQREGERITGFLLQGGDFFPKENAFVEQMTVWYDNTPNDKSPLTFIPLRHKPAVQMWRDFAPLFAQDIRDDEHKGKQRRCPGVVAWVRRLKDEKMLPDGLIRFEIASLHYGDKDFFVDDAFADALSLNLSLLSGLHKGWIDRITAMLRDETWPLVRAVGNLAQAIAKAAGVDEKKGGKAEMDAAQTQAYYRLDIPFRHWLETEANPDHPQGMNAAVEHWWDRSKSIVRQLGDEIVQNCPLQALIGRDGISAPQAYQRFLEQTKSVKSLRTPAQKGGDKGGKQAK